MRNETEFLVEDLDNAAAIRRNVGSSETGPVRCNLLFINNRQTKL